ncbi:MAG: hypothetical protein IKN73_00585 [Alphaproteobacteria bacterium]|jgi:hypothetical protein|nr:hypothetical protein [Alphaproteobacteria bacterium]
MKKICSFLMFLFFGINVSVAASVVATVNGNPITDTDITARTELMSKQGQVSTTNRRKALQNIIDDYVKLNYANNFNVNPTNKDADKELKNMNLGQLSDTTYSMARLAVRSDMAWGVIIARTIIPTVDISEDEIKEEKSQLIRERGLPVETTMIRLIDIPVDTAKKLTKPKNCDAAEKMAEDLGGYPQKITAMQYELSDDIRSRISNLPLLTWSSVQDNSVLLVCSEKKSKEYKDIDEIIKQNAIYRKATVIADQQLKQLRRKAVIIINDDRYKL